MGIEAAYGAPIGINIATGAVVQIASADSAILLILLLLLVLLLLLKKSREQQQHLSS